jgi:hypothetical protein
MSRLRELLKQAEGTLLLARELARTNRVDLVPLVNNTLTCLVSVIYLENPVAAKAAAAAQQPAPLKRLHD